MVFPLKPTKFAEYTYDPEWYMRDFIHSPDGTKEFPNHHCKMTFVAAYPFINNFRNAVDVGCRDGEFSRYLQHNFDMTYCFDPRMRAHFPRNVAQHKVLHFTCALGDEVTDLEMFAGSHKSRAEEPAWTVPCLRLDDFNLQNIDFMKIDVEGFERKVLIGARHTIEKFKPLIVIEQNDERLANEPEFAAKIWLEERGYKHVASCPRGWDYVMEHRQK